MKAAAPLRGTGFTLVEMAAVILIIGIVSSGLVIGVPQYLNHKKIEVTNTKMDFLLSNLSNYAQRHYRLPCPADVSGANRGLERDGGDCLRADNAANDDAALYAKSVGVIPWKELGLTESDVIDGWGRYITYKPAPHLTVNTYSLTMQNDIGARNPADPTTLVNFSTYPDIHNACRQQTWFNSQGLHINRQKALFCCNSEPKQRYLTPAEPDPAAQDMMMTNTWRQNAIQVAGTQDNNVVSTLKWLDDYRATFMPGGGASNNERALAGQFGKIYDSLADPPSLRASSQAVTLISHGGRGTFSYLRNIDGATRLNAMMDPDHVNAPKTDIAAAPDEIKNVWPPQLFAGIIGSPKSSAYDPSGLRDDASDDIVAFLRTDQLIAKAGTASCLKPAGGVYACTRQTYDNFGYLMDTSWSMNEPFGMVTEVNRVGNIVRNANGERITIPDGTRMDALKSAMRRVVTAVIDREVALDPMPDNVAATDFANISTGGCAGGSSNPNLYNDLTKLDTGDFYLNAFLVDPSNNEILMLMDPTPGSSENPASTNGRTPVNPGTGQEYKPGDTIYIGNDPTTPKYYDTDGDGNPDDRNGDGIISDADAVKAEWRLFPLNDTVTVNGAQYTVAQLTKERAYNLITDTSSCADTPLYHTLIQTVMHIGQNGGGGDRPGLLVLSDGLDNIWRHSYAVLPAGNPSIYPGMHVYTEFIGDPNYTRLILNTLRHHNNGRIYFSNGVTCAPGEECGAGGPLYPAIPEGQRYFEGFTVPGQIEITRTDAAENVQTMTIDIQPDNTFRYNGNPIAVTAGELIGGLVKHHYPNVKIHVLDVADNENLKSLSAQTDGYYIRAEDEEALNNFIGLLSSCLAFAQSN